MIFARIRARLRLLARSEHGIALPTALFATIASLGLAGAAVMSSVDVQRGSKRDNSSKSAIGAADAGADVAMQRLNTYGDELGEEEPCLNIGGDGKLAAGEASSEDADWCAPIEGEVGGAEYSYRVSALDSGCAGRDICIASTGTAGEVSRRILLSLDENSLELESSEEEKIEQELELEEQKEGSEQKVKELEEELKGAEEEGSAGGGIAGLIGREEIVLSGSDYIGLNVATNGNLVSSGNVDICGDVQVGVGKDWIWSGHKSQCEGHSFDQGTLEVPSVASFIPSDIATNNSNGRITTCSGGLPADCQKDTYSGNWKSKPPFDPSTRAVSLNGNSTLTVGGGDYWICSLTLSGNSDLVMAEGARTRFFFDTSENCGNPNQIAISGNNKIIATGYQPEQGQFDMPGFYLLGSKSWVSQVAISGNSSGNEFIVYGPDSTIALSGTASKGIIVGKRVTVSGTVTLEWDQGFEPPPEINPGGFDEEKVKKILEEKELTEEELEQILKELEDLYNGGSVEFGGRAFHAQSYVECSGGAAPEGAVPNVSC